MKKLSPWTIILGVVALLVLIYFLGGFREGFTQPSAACPADPNPANTTKVVITGNKWTVADVTNLVDSVASNSLSSLPYVNNYLSWLEALFPSETNPVVVGYLLTTYASNSGVAATGTPPMVTNSGTIPFPTSSTDEFIVNYANALKVFDPAVQGPNPYDIKTIQEALMADINNAGTGNGAYRSNIVWTYFYGKCAAPPPTLAPIKKPSAPSMSGSSAPAPAPAPAPSSSSPSTSTAGPPAASSSPNQPLTFFVPQPCKKEYKSVPGGSVELRCFD